MASRMDQVRDRWERMSSREQRLVVGLGITFVVVVLALLWRSIDSGLADIEERNADTREALSVLEAYRLGEAEASGDERPVEIPETPLKLQSYLEGIATQSGITIPGFNPQTPVTRDGIVESSTRIELDGLSIQELADFLEKVETQSQQVVIKSLDIKRNFRDKEKLDAKLIVTTFSKEKKEGADQEEEG